MSGLAKLLISRGFKVSGSDNNVSELTKELENEGALILYGQRAENITENIDLVVFTAAIKEDNPEYAAAVKAGKSLMTRAELLGQIMANYDTAINIAGTHGKTTTSSMTAHLLHESHVGCNAFLGGIVKNYGTNYLLSKESPFVVVEADEFDRSFHHLRPFATVITATDADHLDIYGTEEAYLESFAHYTSLIQPGGALIVHRGLKMKEKLQEGVTRYDYARTEGDFHAENIRIGGGRILFDFISPLGNIPEVELGVPVSINIENGIAAMALAQLAGAEADEIRKAMKSFGGVVRRFDFALKDERHVLLSDYAHHPAELEQSIRSIREVFNGRRITGIFQPHLYTRTRDFFKDFAASLSLLDEVILTEIYPARELPIPGVTSQLILDEIKPGIPKRLIKKEELPALVEKEDFDVLMVLGAGDADNFVPQLKEILSKK